MVITASINVENYRETIFSYCQTAVDFNPAEGASILAANQDLHPLILEKLLLA
ncbi:hypothetical protein [Caulobacter sp.]|uniref:hypothetical protein n=1 Tax=Caulobacter sp. TaxID=78 RepID=UPI003BAB1382